MKYTQSQRGDAMAVTMICVVIALLFALGWIFWQNFVYKASVQRDTDVVAKNDKDPVPPVAEETDPYDGERITSGNGVYSIKIPNGWYVTVEKDGDGIQESLQHMDKDLKYDETAKPVINKVDYIGGHDAPVFSVGANPGSISDNYTKTSFILNDGTKGARYYLFLPAQEDAFVSNKDIYTYVYRFKKGNSTVTASWTEYLDKGDKLDPRTIQLREEVVKSIEIN